MTHLIGPERWERFAQATDEVRAKFEGRILWNINATPTGGGVAEMLQLLLAYSQGVGVDARWLTLDGEPKFFATTKRLHNFIHGMPGDDGPLGEEERQNFEEVLARNLAEWPGELRPGDVAIVHDPQPAGLIPALKDAGLSVIWRCHIGRDEPNDYTRRAWDFLTPYIQLADRIVVHRPSYTPPGTPEEKVTIIAPSIDPFAAKNTELSAREIHSILVRIGVLDGSDDSEPIPFLRNDGTDGTIGPDVRAEIVGGAVPEHAPIVLQVSRWDRLKDMAGVMMGFVDAADIPEAAHLVLCGPEVSGVTDDPEGLEVFEECIAKRETLPEEQKARVHLVCLPMDDVDANAYMVNALQRYADIVVQKSLFEGFGLTVTEAMWKGRPMVSSAVGGIQDQITDGEEGLLVKDPSDLREFGAAVARLLNDKELADRLGSSARRKVNEEFLADRHLLQYGDLLELLMGARSVPV